MLLLSAPFDRTRRDHRPFPWRAVLEAVAVTSGLVSAGWCLGAWGWPLGDWSEPLMGGATHAGLMAVGWIVTMDGAPTWRGAALRTGAVVIAGSLMRVVGPWGAVVYALVPVVLIAERRRNERVVAAGVSWPSRRFIALGLAAGLFLGVHLLITSSRTFGYVVRISSAGDYLAAVAYDVGVSAVTAEWLFRGALFARWWRRWPFAWAASLSTACAVARYVLDPHMPHALEARLGAVFYLGLLGFIACALRAASGSLVPGYAATVGFFLAYRTLGR